MELQMVFKHMEATDALKNHVKEQSEKLKKFITGPVHAVWTFFVDADIHVADLRIQGPHMDFFAQARTTDLYASIDEAIAKIQKQLRKHKEMVKDHLHRNRK